MSRLALLVLCASAVCAQKKPITLESLREFGREATARNAPGPPHWAPDGKSFAYQQGKDLRLYFPAAKSSRLIVTLAALDDAALKPPDGGPMEWTNRRAHTGGIEWSADGKSLLYTGNGDLFLIHVETGKWDQLTKTPVAEIDPKLSPDGEAVAFRREFDLYVVDIGTHKETRLTSDGSTTLLNGGLDWVYPEEIGLSTAFWWAPDSRSLAYLQFDTSREPLFPHEDLLKPRAVFEPQRYPQVGENNADVRLGVIAAGGGPTRWFDVGDTRNTHLIARAGWMPNGKSLYVVRTNRVQNRMEALAFDLESRAASTLFQESDPYWINLDGGLVFLKDGERFLWTSQRDGYRHIYLYSNDGRTVKQVTRGNWEVSRIEAVDETAGRVFFTSSEATHLERHLYAVGLNGRGKKRLTEEAGTHSISMGPGGAYYLDTVSSLAAAPVTMLRSADGTALSVYRARDAAAEAYNVLPAEIIPFTGAEGTPLYGRLIKPVGFETGKKYPVIVQVYGGPGAAMPARNAWGGIALEQVLAHRGYLVWQAENRGGPGRGHAFETAIYHKLGVNELADQVAGVKHLLSLGIADPQRIGIYGFSYGGFMTLNALLNAADVFHAGFAGAPVTSWFNYDTIYTERYMGLPSENPDGYASTSLPQRAANLRGRLMLVHNVEDDNVLFQNSLQMIDALQAADKQFELMIYPQKTHGITGAASYQMNEMLLEFFDRNL